MFGFLGIFFSFEDAFLTDISLIFVFLISSIILFFAFGYRSSKVFLLDREYSKIKMFSLGFLKICNGNIIIKSLGSYNRVMGIVYFAQYFYKDKQCKEFDREFFGEMIKVDDWLGLLRVVGVQELEQFEDDYEGFRYKFISNLLGKQTIWSSLLGGGRSGIEILYLV